MGHNDALGQAFTFVLAPVMFGAIGWLLDQLLGTGPLLMLVLGCFGAIAATTWAYYQYLERSSRHDEGKPWTRRTL